MQRIIRKDVDTPLIGKAISLPSNSFATESILLVAAPGNNRKGRGIR